MNLKHITIFNRYLVYNVKIANKKLTETSKLTKFAEDTSTRFSGKFLLAAKLLIKRTTKMELIKFILIVNSKAFLFWWCLISITFTKKLT